MLDTSLFQEQLEKPPNKISPNNYIYLIGIVTGLLVALVSFVLFQFYENLKAEQFIYIGLWIGEVFGFLMLLLNGTFIKTKYFRFVKMAIAFIFVGAIFRIMHYSYSNPILISGFVAIIVLYCLSFLKKPIKKRLDYYKLAWVVIGYSSSVLIYLHLIKDDIELLSSVIMWLAIIDYLKTTRQSRERNYKS